MHHQGSILWPKYSLAGRCLLPRDLGSARKHLLDTNVCQTTFGILQPNGHALAPHPSYDWSLRDARERLALGQDRRAALALCGSLTLRRANVRFFDTVPGRRTLAYFIPATRQRLPVCFLTAILGDADDDSR